MTSTLRDDFIHIALFRTAANPYTRLHFEALQEMPDIDDVIQ